ncbi:MAG: efflux RND transporter permease subunit, partial [Deltaproteobacteria bacterium]|nr:efflux RND transporter permease subunit [Deltaproteobacteria bacterium]
MNDQIPPDKIPSEGLADLSIRRPIFITCIVTLMLVVGLFAMKRLGVDLFPEVNFPVIYVATPYPGAGPAEIETLVTKPIEDEVSTLSGLKRVRSISQEGSSVVIAEFTLETDIKFAEQQVRDRVSGVKRKLPLDIKESTIRRIDPADQPILILALKANLPTYKLFDLANEVIRPQLEQVSKVGLVEVVGGRKREVELFLDREKLKHFEISATQVALRLSGAGENIPVGKIDLEKKELIFRTLGQFKSIKDIESTVVNFYGSEVPVTVRDVGTVVDSLTDEISRTYINGEKSLFLFAYRQSGANTLEVVDGLKTRIKRINSEIKHLPGSAELSVVRDGGRWIRNNVEDVQDSILMGVILAIVVVFLFLANTRSTIITGLALPNSLIGAFILMAAFGFTINIMTLLALSLSVGLLIDDAIVVRENIFRHIVMGKSPEIAARTGTKEVRLAVIATSFCVIAVFGPVGFLKGMVGQFFKQFGLTICFAMTISLFDALTIAPMLSTYFAGVASKRNAFNLWDRSIGKVLDGFGHFQEWLKNVYGTVLQYTLQRPLRILGASFLIFLGSSAMVVKVPKTFLPTSDSGEFSLSVDLPPGTNLEAMNEFALKTDKIVR